MSTELAPKKRVRAGHRASTKRFLGQVDTAIAGVPLDVPKITQLKRSLEDKLKSLNILDIVIPEGFPNFYINYCSNTYRIQHSILSTTVFVSRESVQ